MNRTISRAEGIITNRIWNLEKKISDVKERWPEDMYGLRWMEKADKYQKEIDELTEYLNAQRTAKATLEKAKEKASNMFRAKLLLNEIVKTLEIYGEQSLAKRLQRELFAEE